MPTAVGEFIEWLSTCGRSAIYARQCEGVLATFIREQQLEATLVANVTERHIYDFINKPGDDGGGLTWRKTKLCILRSFFDLASARFYRVGNPGRAIRIVMNKMSHAQKEVKPRNPFTDREVVRLLAYTSSRLDELRARVRSPGLSEKAKEAAVLDIGQMEFWRAAAAIGRYTGLRLGDVAQLEWDCLSVAGKIIVWSDKRDRRISLPLKEKVLIDALAAVPRVSKDYLFPSVREEYLNFRTRANLSTQFRRIAEKNGIKGKTFHDLRASFLSDAAERGVPIEHIAQSAGHSSIVTTQRYIKPRVD